MKKVILLTSFGTSERKGIENSIDPIERDINKAFPDYRVIKVFTSRHIREKLLLKHDIQVHSLEGALKRIYKEGVEEVIILPLHLIRGKEQDNIEEIAESYKDKFKSMTIAEPLLSLEEHGGLSKMDDIIEKVISIKPKDEPILFIGHGIKNTCDVPFILVRKELKKRNIKGIYFATLAGNPTFDEIVEELKKDNVNSLTVTSFLIVSGYHAKVDIFGENKEPWCSKLELNGFKVNKQDTSLGERYEFREIYLKSLIKILDK